MKFSKAVYEIVREIPEGAVMTYGQVASMLGGAHKARAVGWSLRALTIEERDVPWWRVVNKRGYLSINQGKGGVEKQMQRDLLMDEGIEVDDKYIVDLEKYLLRPLD